jgi:hypothetical protein
MGKPENVNFKPPGSWASVVPQVFYDIIARIIPGSILLLCFYYLSNDEIRKYLQTELDGFAPHILVKVFIWILGSYVFVLLIWQIAGISKYLYRKILKLNNWFKKIINNKNSASEDKSPEDATDSDDFVSKKDIAAYIYDFIKTQDYAAGARITKLRAEIHATEVLSVGLIFLFLYYVYILKSNNDSVSWIHVLIFLIFFIGLIKANIYFRKSSSMAIRNYFLIYKGICQEGINSEIKEIVKEIRKYKKDFKDYDVPNKKKKKDKKKGSPKTS